MITIMFLKMGTFLGRHINCLTVMIPAKRAFKSFKYEQEVVLKIHARCPSISLILFLGQFCLIRQTPTEELRLVHGWWWKTEEKWEGREQEIAVSCHYHLYCSHLVV